MSVRVAVDFGTSSTCVVLSVDGQEPQVVVVDGQPLVPSAVFVATDGTLFVGQEAERQAAVDPSRYEPHPKRRIDEGELLLGNTVLPVQAVVRAVLSRAAAEAARLSGGWAIDFLVLTHPADWGAIRTRVLRHAAEGLAREVVLVPEPVAAAVFHAAAYPPAEGRWDGTALAVLDLGGGTVDASVVRREGAQFRVLATKGDPSFGGADIDQALLEHAGSLVTGEDPEAWRALMEGRDLADRRRRRVLRQDVRGAKETLSRHPYTDVPMPPPFPDAHVTRADLERLITAPLTRAADLVLDTMREAGLAPQQLLGVFLVGGSSRIPLVSRLVYQRAGVLPTTLDQPETVVARGALRAINLDPDRTGDLSAVAEQALHTRYSAAGAPPVATAYPGAADATTVIHGRVRPSDSSAAVGSARRRWLIVGAVAAVVAAGAASTFALTRGDSAPKREIAQYDYRFTLPDGWGQSGADAGKRRVQLKPDDARPNTDLLVVDESLLSYDATGDRARAVREIHQSGYDREAASGIATGFQENASFVGRDVVYYREKHAGLTADWYVLFQGGKQVSVACQYDPAGQRRVHDACDQVVRSLAITG